MKYPYFLFHLYIILMYYSCLFFLIVVILKSENRVNGPHVNNDREECKHCVEMLHDNREYFIRYRSWYHDSGWW